MFAESRAEGAEGGGKEASPFRRSWDRGTVPYSYVPGFSFFNPFWLLTRLEFARFGTLMNFVFVIYIYLLALCRLCLYALACS